MEKVYTPPNKELWTGRNDGIPNERYFQVINCLDLKKNFPSNAITILGFACDEGVRRNQGRIGAKNGPSTIRSALASLPVFNQLSIVDVGDITCIDPFLEDAQNLLANTIYKLLKTNNLSCVLGGGHEVAWGHFQGIKKAFPDKKIGIINIDAHYDLRKPFDKKPSSGTPFLQIAESEKNFDYTCIGIQRLGNTKTLFNKAKELNVYTVLAEEIHLKGIQKALDTVKESLCRNDIVYFTICLDVFASPYAPGVSAPTPLGLFPWHVIPIIETIAQSKKCVAFDIAEMNPTYDKDNNTAKLAASLIASFLNQL